MASIEGLKIGIQKARAELLEAIAPEALKAAADAAALVENRIVTTGANSQGGRLSPYSTTPVPAFFFLGRSRNNKGEAAIRKKVAKKQPVSYAEFRALNGLNIDKKNLEFTGEMWQGFGVVGATTVSPGIVEVTIGGKNARTKTLLGYHSEREKTNITQPSQAEMAAISAALSDRLIKIIVKNLQ